MTARALIRLRVWLRNASEFRTGLLLAVAGACTTIAGAALYVLPGPGFPVLVIGLSSLVTGLVMVGAGGHRDRS